MNVKVLFLITSFLFVNICFSQVTEDIRNKSLNEFKTDRDAKFGVFNFKSNWRQGFASDIRRFASHLALMETSSFRFPPKES